MCDVLDQQQVGTNFDLQTKEASSAPETKANTTSRSNIGTNSNFLNIPDYFRSITKKEADKGVSRL